MSKINRKETNAMDTNAQIICANLVSGACTSPLVDEVFNSICSYLPLHKFQIAVSTLPNAGEYRKAFDLICAIFEIVDGEIPDEFIAIESHQEVVRLFVNELTEDLASILEEDECLLEQELTENAVSIDNH